MPDDDETTPATLVNLDNSPPFPRRMGAPLDPDDEPTRPEQISNLGDRPELRQNSSERSNAAPSDKDDIPTLENTRRLDVNAIARVDRDPKDDTPIFRRKIKLKAEEDGITEENARAILLDEHAARAKQSLAQLEKALENEREARSEAYYWKNGWGVDREEIIKNIGKFYIPINVKGQFRLKHDGPDGETEFMKKEEFLNIFESQRTILTVESASGTRNKDISIGQMFTAHNRDRPFYMGLTFNPDPKWKNPNIYNQFQGWPIKPVKGDVQIFLDYAYDVSFNREDRNCKWGLGWSAQIFLEPHIVMGSAMVHRGEEGIGKSFFAETLAMLLGKYYVKITDFDQVFGQFNAHIEYALLTHFEEAFWAGIVGLRAGLRIMFPVRRALSIRKSSYAPVPNLSPDASQH